jgi:DNA-directed RNA polymerase specialized sigma24 family protein
LWSLRELVVRRELPVAVVNRMWMLLVSGAASRGESATVGAVGMALPALCALARELSGSRRGDCVDLDAEILSGFLSSLAAARPCSGGLFPSLLRHARAAGLAWVTAQRVAARDVPLEPALLGHLTAPEDPRDVDPGQVLTELVDLRVITERDAELISATRLEGIPAREVAAAAKLPYDTLRKRRLRAECRVAAYLGGRPAHEPSDPRPPECCRARDGRRGFGSRSGRDGPAGPNGHGGRASCRTRSRGMTR